MERWLLAAEADKIQDLLFRASSLAEVAGGSGLLTRFCKEVPKACLGLKDEEKDILVSEGGAFRLLFDSVEQATTTGRMLADYYYMATGGQLTVAEPVLWDGFDASFPYAYERANLQLRSAKVHAAPALSAHMPAMAFCASTGVEVAAHFKSPKAGRVETYLSRSTWIKKGEQAESKKGFIGQFVRQVTDKRDYEWPWEAEQLGNYDPRDYVAYMVADGNNMGELFSSCQDREALQRLSSQLGHILQESVAIPTRLLMKRCGEKEKLVPVLPLILGGDDLFILLPAKWAISFAKEFCLAFERLMGEFMAKEGFAARKPTMAAAVVICKSKYPFFLAHQRGEELLKEAKRLAKSQGEASHSTINFELISGNGLVDVRRERNYRPTLRPYWAAETPEKACQEDGISVQQLLDFRYGLYLLPHKRRAQLRSFFEPPKLQTKDDLERKRWALKLNAIVARISELEGASQSLDKRQESLTLAKALTALGGKEETNYWPTIRRGGELVHGHALPDLFDVWEFLHDLRQDVDVYLEGAV